MATVKYYAFNVWVIFDGEKESVPFFDLIACDIEAAKADIAETYGDGFTLLSYTQKDMVKEVVYNF